MKRIESSIFSLASAGLMLGLQFGSGLLAGNAHAQSGTQPLGCLIEPERQAEVGSPLIGVVESVAVDRGSAVKKGQILAVMRAEVERANVESARTRAGADAEIQAAFANRDVAKIKLKRTVELAALGFASQLEVDQAKGEFEVADQRHAQAREGKQIAERELTGAQAQLRQRTVRAPFDGVVVDRLIQPGERVDGRPMFRVAALNPLRVEVIIPSSYYGQIREGMSLTVQPEFTGATNVNAQVTQVDRLVDAASGTFRARLTMPNPKQDVPAGVRCKMALNGAEVPAPKAAATSGTAPSNGITPAAASAQGATAVQANFKAEVPKLDMPKAAGKN